MSIIEVSKVMMTAQEMQIVLVRLAHEIAERNKSSSAVLLLGIQRGGPHLANRISNSLAQIWGHPVPTGTIDVALHRDDLDHRPPPELFPTHIPCGLDEKVVILVDDVMQSGRTTRAALDALTDFGRPKAVQLAVLVDRGSRELPIHADYVGKHFQIGPLQRIDVLLKEDGMEDCVRVKNL